jgi:ABC-2 type transport system permease protein
MAKVQMHLLVCGVPAVVSGLICALTLQLSPLEFFLALAIPALLTLLTALFGVVVNLQFPKFDWINELQPIKQGVSVLLTMLGVFAFIAALAALYVALSAVLSVQLYMAICAVAFALMSGALSAI